MFIPVSVFIIMGVLAYLVVGIFTGFFTLITLIFHGGKFALIRSALVVFLWPFLLVYIVIKAFIEEANR